VVRRPFVITFAGFVRANKNRIKKEREKGDRTVNQSIFALNYLCRAALLQIRSNLTSVCVWASERVHRSICRPSYISSYSHSSNFVFKFRDRFCGFFLFTLSFSHSFASFVVSPRFSLFSSFCKCNYTAHARTPANCERGHRQRTKKSFFHRQHFLVTFCNKICFRSSNKEIHLVPSDP
jgi:hypothetical protein